ncbi:hypothetical protein HCY52_07945 [Acinetobacter radioresistens]|uniref:hypothetical protein n=1 Tax=Acinetobacter radioresistens TaxID=40216 RepID=UPI002006D2BF|nr:hypothetical protein [Acinetobacter radioresistens]MCK4083746.1 hypothetical protein [Acinetobacter radioresistens]
MMKHNILIGLLSVLSITQVYSAEKQSTPVDTRKGYTVKQMVKENPQDLAFSQQKGGVKPLYAENFSPTLAQWFKGKEKIKYTSSGFVYEKDFKVPQPPKSIEEVADLSRIQYFYKQSLHAELVGPKAKEIIDFTHSRGGKVYVSTSIIKVYPEKTYTDEDTQKVEISQCVDVLTRITVTKVPMRNTHGLERLIDYWHDIKNYQCRSNAETD